MKRPMKENNKGVNFVVSAYIINFFSPIIGVVYLIFLATNFLLLIFSNGKWIRVILYFIIFFPVCRFIVLNLHNNIECNVKKLLYSSAIFLPIIVIKLVILTPNFKLATILSTQYSTSLLCLGKINLHTLMYKFCFFSNHGYHKVL